MADLAPSPVDSPIDHHSTSPSTVQPPILTPGKVAIWLFLATEVMFFTGLIGTYIVLRAGSPSTAYSNLFPPATDLTQVLKAPPKDLVTSNWPRPYDGATNPLSIDLTAINTFILICSSVTMVLALSAFQRNERWKGARFVTATALIGSVFLGVQVYEYYQLMFGHHYPVGISASGHFTPDASLFASCFFTMTGFHGAHVAAGVVAMSILAIRSWFGAYNSTNYAAVEVVGLYWHFVDLVWILLFTVVYLI
ncbi:cytochrome c oxidase subunit 3 [Tundrisphaera lichenicola]|uniref:cytochrome c oxidase subunit 3 n=1 Tax=Tundrisphaera lichenicola TaxID=2029860 RepID=UPI003EBE866B